MPFIGSMVYARTGSELPQIFAEVEEAVEDIEVAAGPVTASGQWTPIFNDEGTQQGSPSACAITNFNLIEAHYIRMGDIVEYAIVVECTVTVTNSPTQETIAVTATPPIPSGFSTTSSLTGAMGTAGYGSGTLFFIGPPSAETTENNILMFFNSISGPPANGTYNNIFIRSKGSYRIEPIID